jgi:N-acetylmuramoyl-L-alanine amidase
MKWMAISVLVLVVSQQANAQDSPAHRIDVVRLLIDSLTQQTKQLTNVIDSLRRNDRAMFVRTTGPMPYMEYGPGDDRLGGAKMTYLDSNILMRVVDSTVTDYVVQLSAAHRGFVLKSNVRPDTLTTPAPYHLSSSWRVYGNATHDFISVQLDERLPYRSQHTSNPSGITIDLFGVTSNTNWITQTGTAIEITDVWYEQLEDDVLRMHIRLKNRQHWGHYIHYDSLTRRLMVMVKRQPSKLRLRHLQVAIDAGHGGANTGAMGTRTRVLEKEYTLGYAKQLQQYLKRKGVNTYMTRETDTDISMIDRALQLRKADPHVLLSLHFNSSANTSVHGTSTYYRYIGFRPLSQAILACMLQTGLANYGNIGSFNFALSGPMEYPNCLVEIAFLSNEADEQKIADPKFAKRVAKQIHRGLKKWARESRN